MPIDSKPASTVDTGIKSASDALKSTVDAAVADAIAKDNTLQADYDERDQLTAARRANAIALSACQQRIAQKEGPELIEARTRQQLLDMPTEQLQRLVRGGR